MHFEQSPNDWSPGEDAGDEIDRPTESRGELIPPPHKPPTAIGAAASGPEPHRPILVRRWNRRTREPVLPRAVVDAVDAALDVLDSIGDSVRAAAGLAD
jgi:hypothetical protein